MVRAEWLLGRDQICRSCREVTRSPQSVTMLPPNGPSSEASWRKARQAAILGGLRPTTRMAVSVDQPAVVDLTRCIEVGVFVIERVELVSRHRWKCEWIAFPRNEDAKELRTDLSIGDEVISEVFIFRALASLVDDPEQCAGWLPIELPGQPLDERPE